MKLTVRSNIDRVLADLDGFVEQVLQVAAPRAVNKLSDQAQTAGLRKVADIYDIGPRTMEKYATVRLASASDPTATIMVKGRGFPLSAFKPRQTRAGVSVTLKGRRVLVPHTFLATMPSGHIGVFARGKYGPTPGRGKSRRKRPGHWTELPIHELLTFGPAEAFSNTDVVEAMNDRIQEQAAKVLGQEIRFAVRTR